MFKLLLIFLLGYLFLRVIRRFFKGLFFITRIPNPNTNEPQNPYTFRGTSKEKDISDRARILEEDKNREQNP